MDPIALAAATALLGAMATDAWQQVRTAVIAYWRKNHPERAKDIGRELDGTYSQAITAALSGEDYVEQSLIKMWTLRFQQLIDADPRVRQEVRQLLDEHLTPALPTIEQTQVRQNIHLHAQDHARQYVAGRDQHITE